MRSSVICVKQLPTCRTWPVAGLFVLFVAALVAPQPADASCNIIPGTTRSFRSTGATVDRPFATPGDWVELSLDPTCHATSPGWLGSPGDHVVTVVYEPTAPGLDRSLVFVTDDCLAIEAQRAGCASDPDVAEAACVEVGTVVAASPPIGLNLVLRDNSVTNLRFRFPNTDDVLAPAADLVTLSGPAAIAVTAKVSPLPCGLATASCAAQPGLIACVDQLFAANGSCQPTPHEVFTHFTALPVRNNYQAICTNPTPPCTGLDDVVRFGIDDQGNILIPMDWRGVLVGGAVPVARLLRGSSTVEAFEGTGQPISVPGVGFLGSYSPEGGKLPPLFDPQVNTTDPDRATFFGSADAPETVLRVLRRSPAFTECSGGGRDGLPCVFDGECPSGSCGATQCAGGLNDGLACVRDSDCPDAECGGALFDFTTRTAAGVGPVLIALGTCLGGDDDGNNCTDNADCAGGSCGDFEIAALDPVPLDGLTQTDNVNAFVVAEAIDNTQINDDPDTLDYAIKLANRASGDLHAIGGGASKGRAVVRVRQPPFSFAALAVENDLVAFLESEPSEGFSDSNADADVFDSILRVYEQTGGAAVEITAGNDLSADADPSINRRSVVVSNGRVFFRTAEADDVAYQTDLVSVDSLGVEAVSSGEAVAISADGSVVAFSSEAENIDPADTNNREDVFVYDRSSGVNELVSLDSDGNQANHGSYSGSAALSGDGNLIIFESVATNLVADDTNAATDVFLHDRSSGATERVSVDSDENEVSTHSGDGAISANGDVIALGGDSELDPPDANPFNSDVYVRRRSAGTTTVVSVDSLEMQGSGNAGSPSVSELGTAVLFGSEASTLVPGDTNAARDIFVRYSSGSGETVRVSVDSFGNQANADSYPGDSTTPPLVSSDGQVVAFLSGATNLVAGDTNDAWDVFVRDVRTGQTTRVDTPSGEGLQFGANLAALSGNGRYVAFISHAPSIDPHADALDDAFVYDRITGHSTKISVGPAGGPADADSDGVALSADGRVVAFSSSAENLTTIPDTNGLLDAFVRGPVPGDVVHDYTGDGAHDDIVLRVLDASAGPPGTLQTLCPAEQVVVADGRAAFLRPESAGETTNPGCTGPDLIGPLLNDDADENDTVVHLYDGTSVQNLRCAATAVAISDTHVVALVSEADEAGGDLDGDMLADDLVVHVRSVGAGAPASCDDPTWVNLQEAAATVAIDGSLVAFGQPRPGLLPANALAHVLHVYDAGAMVPAVDDTGWRMEDYVVSGTLIAFRTRELTQPADLNEDGDFNDDVLQVYDATAPPGQRVINSKMAVTPCRLEACDPHVPYRVLGDTVKFLTLEADQGDDDLNGDGDSTDLVLQSFNVRRAQADPGDPQPPVIAEGSVSAGICTDTAEACASDTDCPAGTCFLPPGGCIRDLGTMCTPDPTPPNCGPAQFCQPISGMPGQGTCFAVENSCKDDSDCTAPAFCNAGEKDVHRLPGPFDDNTKGDASYTGAGLCLEDVMTACTTAADCGAGEHCGDAGSCLDYHGPCRTTDDCPPGTDCVRDLGTSTAADVDLDEVPDPYDNCPYVANVDQTDGDDDGVGDACELAELACAAAPLTTCRDAGKTQLKIKDSPTDDKDQLKWKWSKGDETLYTALGTPRSTTSYALCVYDSTAGVDALAIEIVVPPNPQWTEKVPRNIAFGGKEAPIAGVQQIKLKAGAAGKAAAQLKAKGLGIPLPPPFDGASFFDQGPRVTAQLVTSDGQCWTSEFSPAQTTANTTAQFKAKGP